MEPSLPLQNDLAPAIRCAENIAILRLLHDVPVQPSLREIHLLPGNTTRRILPLEQENQLTSVLALLSALRDDTRHVTATAFRERSRPQGLEILVAINKASPTDGDEYLKEIKAGLHRIFCEISSATEEYDAVLEARLFAEIISVCRKRILSRLRFGAPKPRRVRQPLADRLQHVSGAVSDLHGTETRTFVEATRKLISLLKSFPDNRPAGQLIQIVEEAHSWAQMGDMSHIFKTVSTRKLDPQEYPGLREIIWKIGQYRTAARRLYRIARGFRIVRHITIIPVNLDPTVFSRITLDNHIPDIAMTLKRLSRGDEKATANLCRHLPRTPEAAQTSFQNTVARNLNSSKIHAEVQILAYLMVFADEASTTPRVVQSNKKACYLCNMLFNTNDNMPAMLKGHGRLYDAWRLPLLPGMKDLQIRLNNVLEDQARKSIALLLQKKQRVGYPVPYESSALLISSATSTIMQEMEEAPGTARTTSIQSEIHSHKSEDSDAGSSIQLLSTSDSNEELPILDGNEPEIETADGQTGKTEPHEAPLESLSAGQTSSAYEFGESKVWVEYSVGPQRHQGDERLVYSARSLENLKLQVPERTHAIDVLDVTSMEPGSEMVIPALPKYCLDLGDVVVELTFQSK